MSMGALWVQLFGLEPVVNRLTSLLTSDLICACGEARFPLPELSALLTRPLQPHLVDDDGRIGATLKSALNVPCHLIDRFVL